VSVGGKHLDVIDTKTGTCKGRIGREGNWRALAVSPDGQRLAGVRSQSPASDGHEIHAWDLKTGNRTGVVPALKTGNSAVLHWANASELYLASDEHGLYDMDHRILLGRIAVERDSARRRPLNDGPDGRPWALIDDKARGQGAITPVKVGKPAGSLAFRPGIGVRVDADCGDAKRSARANSTIANIFKEAGHPNGGEWTLRLAASEHDTGKLMTLVRMETKVPGVKGTFELVDPQGQVAATTTYQMAFPQRGSRYFKKTENGPGRGAPETDVYDFGGRDPLEAMAEETWDLFLKGLDSAPIPRGAWRTESRYLQLPLNLEYQ
jgi:hypothetical protein